MVVSCLLPGAWHVGRISSDERLEAMSGGAGDYLFDALDARDEAIKFLVDSGSEHEQDASESTHGHAPLPSAGSMSIDGNISVEF